MLDRLKTVLMKRLDKATARLASLESATTADSQSMRAVGNAFLQEGRYADAEHAYRRAVSANPLDIKALVNLGYVLKEQKRLFEARVYLKRAISLSASDPAAHETHYLFGLVAEEQGDLEEARSSYTKAFELDPTVELVCRDLCRVLFWMGKTKEAQSVLDQGLLQNPQCGDFHFYQGNLHVENGNSERAAKSYAQALHLGAAYADVYGGLGAVQYQLGEELLALENFKQAQQIDSSFESEAHYQAGCFCLRRGDYLAAISRFESALALRPDLIKVHSSLIFSLSFNTLGPPTYREAIQRYGELLKKLSGPAKAIARQPYEPGSRALRVGFVSGELKKHPVGFFLEGILRSINQARLHLTAYSNTSTEDPTTERLRPGFAQWRDIKGLKDEAVAQLIRDDKVDILVDLGGHTGDNRLPVFALRAAPVQVAWLGYFASTGVPEMDYILADRIGVPEGHTEFFSEKIWYLPDTRLCMTPPVTQREIAVSAPPSKLAGFITFGTFQARTKINDQVLAVWSKVLDAVPNARLRLQVQQMHIPALRNDLQERMLRAGIDLDRVSISSGLHWEAYLADYENVDIVLDTFPYTGGTTTAEALWMGVPTLTLMGDTMLSRQGASMLSCVGLHDWVANSETEYVSKAVQFAHSLAGLSVLRAELRNRAMESPLFDTRRFAANLQECFESIFRAKD